MKNNLFRLGLICLILFTFTAFAGIEEDFEAYNLAELTKSISLIEQESKPGSPCYKNSGYTKCIFDLSSKSSPGSGIAFFTMTKLIKESLKDVLVNQKECNDVCHSQMLILANFAISDLILKIKPEDLTVRSWSKSKPAGTPGLLYIQIKEDFDYIKVLKKKITETLPALDEILDRPGIPPEVKSIINDYIKKLTSLNVNEKFKNGLVFDQTITVENVLKDYDSGQGVSDTSEVKAQKRKNIINIFAQLKNPSASNDFSKYLDYTAKEMKQIMAWKETNFDRPGECPAGSILECFVKFSNAHIPKTSAGISATFSITMTILAKERKAKECDEACKLKLTVKVYEQFNAFTSQLKIVNLPVAQWRQKNLGKPGMLGLQALEEILIGKFITTMNANLQSMFANLAAKPGLAPDGKTQYEKILLELKATNYKEAFKGSIISDLSIVPTVVEEELKKTPEGSATPDLMKNFTELRTAMLP